MIGSVGGAGLAGQAGREGPTLRLVKRAGLVDASGPCRFTLPPPHPSLPMHARARRARTPSS